MEWSPQAAMKAFLHTLHLNQNKENKAPNERKEITEPKCMEFISALAAGKQAKLMVEISTEGITPLTIALAVAAKQIKGSKIKCILINQKNFKKSKNYLKEYHQELTEVIELIYGNPFQLIMEYKNIDFLVIDGKLEDNLKLVKNINLNINECIILGHNLQYRKGGICFGQVLKKGNNGIVTLPIGEGIELTRIESISKCKRSRRFHVMFDD